MTGLYVLTSPRPGENRWPYVSAVIDAAKEEAIPNAKTFVVDGTQTDVDELRAMAPGWNVHRYERPDGVWLGGNKWPYWSLLELASLIGDDAVVLEDDLEFAPNALQRMLLFPVPADVAVVQFFSGFLFSQPQMPPGLWRTPAPVRGAQALKFKTETLALLVRWKAEDAEWQKFNESDTALGVVAERLRLRWSHHLPDIVQHVGSISAVAHEMVKHSGVTGPVPDMCDHSLSDRMSINYVGKHFDCLRLFARHDRYL